MGGFTKTKELLRIVYGPTKEREHFERLGNGEKTMRTELIVNRGTNMALPNIG